MGSKARHAVELITITCANRRPGQHYIEPMVGGGNVICKVPRADGPRIANDINHYMVALLEAVGNRDWFPPETMTKAQWSKIKKNPEIYPPELVAFAATGPTFGSQWFHDWVQDDIKGYPPNGFKYITALNALQRDASGLKGIVFHSGSYEALNPHIPPESIIYCDPPYANTTIYEGAKTKIAIGESLAKNTWKPLAFWKWADALVDQGHRVYVSEYKGPPAAIYSGMTPALRAESDALRAAYRASAADPASPASLREELSFKIADVDARVQAGADALAARWRVMWEKEVVSDFSSVRTEENSGKREVERLFHREP
jgi:DNA adenine methylase